MESITTSVEQVDAVTRKIRVSIPSSEVDREYEASLERAAGQAVVKGFRPGKAPKQLVATMHGSAVRGEVLERLVSKSLQDAVKKNELEVVGPPEIEGADLELGKPLQFTAKFAIFPRPEVKEVSEYKIRVGKRTPTDKDVDQVIERLRESKATPRKLEFRNKAQKGDIADLSVVSALEGETDARPEPVSAEIGNGNLPPELEQGLLGMEIGESKNIAGSIPNTHRDPKLRGKAITYKVTLNQLSEKILPEVNDDFAKSLDLQVSTLLELRLKVRTSLEEENTKQAKVDTEAALLEEIVNQNPFEVPQVLVDEEIRSLIARSGFVDPNKVDVRALDVAPFREGLQEIGEKRVKSAILVDRIGELRKIKAEDEEIKQRITDIATENKVSEAEVQKFLAQGGRMVNMVMEIGRSKVIKSLMEKAVVEYFEKPEEKQEAA